MKRRNLTQVITFLLAICMLISTMSACGGGGGQGTVSAEKNENNTTEASSAGNATEDTSAKSEDASEDTTSETGGKIESESVETDEVTESASAETNGATESIPVETNDVTESVSIETNEVTESVTKEPETETEGEPITPDWDNLPEVDTEIAYVDRSVGYVDGTCVISTEYNSRNMILGARYEILAYARYYVKTEFTYSKDGPLTELYVEVTGEARYRYVFEYDEAGNLISSKYIENGRERDLPVTLEYHANGLVKKVGNDEFMQEFDALGRLILEDIDETRATVQYGYSGNERKPDSVKVLFSRGGAVELTPHYNEDGKVDGVKEDYPDSKYYIDYTFSYTPENRVEKTEAKAINYENELYWTVFLENGYDERLNVTYVKNVRYAADNSVLRKEDSEFEYDERNNLTRDRFTSYNSDLSINYIDDISYKYDDENKLIWRESKNYEGDVLESVATYTYEYYSNGLLKTERDVTEYFRENMRGKRENITEYHENGKTAKNISYSYDVDGNILSYYCTEYDDQGRTVRNAYTRSIDSEYGANMFEEFYDENRRVIKNVDTNYNMDGSVRSKEETTRFYNDDGNVVKTESSTYDGNGAMRSKMTVLLDTNGKIISQNTDYYNENGTSNGKEIFEYTYYDNGVRKNSSYTFYYASGAVRRSEVTDFDEKGNDIFRKVHEYTEDGRLTETTDSISEYDADGNRTKFVYARFLGDGRLLYKETYTYEYEFYDDGRKKSEISTLYDTDNVISQIEEREYSISGDTIRETRKEFYPDGTLSSLYTYERDPETGKAMSSYVEYNEDGSVSYEEKEEW